MWKTDREKIFIFLLAAVLLAGCGRFGMPAGTPPDGGIVRIGSGDAPLSRADAANHMATALGAYACQNLEGELVVHISSDVAGRRLLKDFWQQLQTFKTLRYSADPQTPCQLSSRVRNGENGTVWILVLRRDETILWSESVALSD